MFCYGKVERDRSQVDRLELRQMNRAPGRFPFLRVREVMQNHLADVEIAPLFGCRRRTCQRCQQITDHDLRKSQRKKTGSSNNNMNTKPTRLSTMGAVGSAAVRVVQYSVTPTAPNRSSMPPSQPAMNRCVFSRTNSRDANAISCSTYATIAAVTIARACSAGVSAIATNATSTVARSPTAA